MPPFEYLDGEDPYAGMSPIDRYRLSIEIANKQQLTPEQQAANAEQNTHDALSVLPGIGSAVSLKDAWDDSGRGAQALGEGRYKDAIGSYLGMLANTAGAVLPLHLPNTPAAKQAAADAPTQANMFLGTSAKNADHAALDVAREMERSGKGRDEILAATGWHRSAKDKRWKWETDDRATGLTDQASINFDGAHRGEVADFGEPADLFKHPELYDNYSDLAPFHGETTLKKGRTEGGYHGSTDTINVTGRNQPAAESIFLHELQHGVQKREGFARGGANAKGYYDLKSDWAKRNPGRTLSMREMQDLEDEAYRRNAGEVEARNVEARKDMTPEERRAVGPWYTQDIPDEKQMMAGPTEAEPWFEGALIPPSDTPKAMLAKQLGVQPPKSFNRLGGKDKFIHDQTGLVFGPEGGLRQEISDLGMVPTGRKFTGGDKAPLKDVVKHPTLFDVRPDLADLPVNFRDIPAGHQPVARTLPEGGFDLSTGQTEGSLRGNLAKLMQYDIGQKAGFAAPVRHGVTGTLKQLDDTIAAAEKGLRAEKLPPSAALPFVTKLKADRAAIASMIEDPLSSPLLAEQGVNRKNAFTPRNLQNSIGRAVSDRVAGNVDANVARNRALLPGPVMPYEGARPFNQQIVMPTNMDELEEFIKQWHKSGAGSVAEQTYKHRARK